MSARKCKQTSCSASIMAGDRHDRCIKCRPCDLDNVCEMCPAESVASAFNSFISSKSGVSGKKGGQVPTTPRQGTSSSKSKHSSKEKTARKPHESGRHDASRQPSFSFKDSKKNGKDRHDAARQSTFPSKDGDDSSQGKHSSSSRGHKSSSHNKPEPRRSLRTQSPHDHHKGSLQESHANDTADDWVRKQDQYNSETAKQGETLDATNADPSVLTVTENERQNSENVVLDEGSTPLGHGQPSLARQAPGSVDDSLPTGTPHTDTSRSAEATANRHLAAQVASYREELRELKQKLATYQSAPSISGYDSQQDEFAHEQDDVQASDSVSNVATKDRLDVASTSSSRAGPPSTAQYLSAPPKVDPEAPRYQDLLRFIVDYNKLPKRSKDSTDDSQQFQNQLELLLGEKDATKAAITTIPPSDTVVYWLQHFDDIVRGSGNKTELLQFEEALVAHPNALQPGKYISNEKGRLFAPRAYKLHDSTVSSRPLVLDPNYALLGHKDSDITLKSSTCADLEAMMRHSMGMLSFLDHSMLTMTKLLKSGFRVPEGEQPHSDIRMILGLMKSSGRAINNLASLNAAVLTNTVLYKRDAFLAKSSVANDTQLKAYLRATSTKHSTLFANKIDKVHKVVSDRKRSSDKAFFKRPSGPPPKARRVSFSSQPASSYSANRKYDKGHSSQHQYHDKPRGCGRPFRHSSRGGRGARSHSSSKNM